MSKALKAKIIVKGKCLSCGKNMTDEKDGLYICYKCKMDLVKKEVYKCT